MSVAAAPAVRIIEPGADEILYGKTRVVADCAPGLPVAHVLFYVDPFKKPICDSTRAPHTCEFNAGFDFQRWRLRAVALDASLAPLGEAAVDTLAFVRPEKVVRYTLDVPVIA